MLFSDGVVRAESDCVREDYRAVYGIVHMSTGVASFSSGKACGKIRATSRRFVSYGTLMLYVIAFVGLPALHRHDACCSRDPGGAVCCCSVSCHSSCESCVDSFRTVESCGICRILYFSIPIPAPPLTFELRTDGVVELIPSFEAVLASFATGTPRSRAPPCC